MQELDGCHTSQPEVEGDEDLDKLGQDLLYGHNPYDKILIKDECKEMKCLFE